MQIFYCFGQIFLGQSLLEVGKQLKLQPSPPPPQEKSQTSYVKELHFGRCLQVCCLTYLTHVSNQSRFEKMARELYNIFPKKQPTSFNDKEIFSDILINNTAEKILKKKCCLRSWWYLLLKSVSQSEDQTPRGRSHFRLVETCHFLVKKGGQKSQWIPENQAQKSQLIFQI